MSSVAQLLLTTATPHNPGELHVDFAKLHVDFEGLRYHVLDEVELPNYQGEHWMRLEQMCEGLVVPVTGFRPFERNQVFTFWPLGEGNGLIKGVRRIADHLIRKCEVKIIDHVTIGDVYQRELLGWLLIRKMPVRTLVCFNTTSDNPSLVDQVANDLYSNPILQFCTGDLTSLLDTSDEYQPNNLKTDYEMTGRMMILKATWVKLIKAKVPTVDLYGVRWTNKEVNGFLREWRVGRHEEKKKVVIRLAMSAARLDFERILEGFNEGFGIIPTDFTIKRIDGREARVKLSDDGRLFEVDFTDPN